MGHGEHTMLNAEKMIQQRVSKCALHRDIQISSLAAAASTKLLSFKKKVS
jgi:hypothetical protein